MSHFAYVDSPIGRLRLHCDAKALTALILDPDAEDPAETDPAAVHAPRAAPLAAAARQLEQYFAGARREFDLPLATRGTPFQERVWHALIGIPYGRTASYGELARRIGRPGAARAVGMANNRNPLPIVVPCHRVIGADGSLVGYGGGLERKRWLLALEAATAAPERSRRPA